MKSYSVYTHIRKRAMILGLPMTFFALQMVAVIGSLLIIIFSFQLSVIVGLLLFNVLLYGALGQWVKRPFRWLGPSLFPHTISNKNLSPRNHG